MGWFGPPCEPTRSHCQYFFCDEFLQICCVFDGQSQYQFGGGDVVLAIRTMPVCSKSVSQGSAIGRRFGKLVQGVINCRIVHHANEIQVCLVHVCEPLHGVQDAFWTCPLG